MLRFNGRMGREDVLKCKKIKPNKIKEKEQRVTNFQQHQFSLIIEHFDYLKLEMIINTQKKKKKITSNI